MKNIAYMKNSTILGSAKPTFSSAKLIGKKLSIVNCALSIVNHRNRINIFLLWLMAMMFLALPHAQAQYSDRTCDYDNDLSTPTTSWQSVSGSITSGHYRRYDVNLTAGRKYIFSLCY